MNKLKVYFKKESRCYYMLNKSMMIKLLVFAMILVGCASSDVVTEKAKKGESSKVLGRNRKRIRADGRKDT